MPDASRAGDRLRVLIVDDHAVVRTGLQAMLDGEPDLQVVGVAADAEGAIETARSVQPHVVLMDVRLGEGDAPTGIDACRAIREERSETRVVMFTSFGERESVLAAIMAGASGYLTKNVSHRRLIDGVRAVGRGESILDSSVTGDVINRLTDLIETPVGAGDGGLSARELEVLELIVRGQTNKAIAEALVISPYTARNHVASILSKLGVSRRSEAAAVAVREQLLRSDQ